MTHTTVSKDSVNPIQFHIYVYIMEYILQIKAISFLSQKIVSKSLLLTDFVKETNSVRGRQSVDLQQFSSL